MAGDDFDDDSFAAREWPKVSVVIATHNRPELVVVAVGGVIAQDYPGDIECLVVFDQSEVDPSLEHGSMVDRPTQLRRVRVMENIRSPGLAGARNSGILASDGEFVAFCDDDDEWSPCKLTAQIRALRRASAATAVSGITVLYGENEVERIPPAAQLSLNELTRRRVMEAHPSTVVVRRASLVEPGTIGLIDENIPGSYGEDFDWIIRAAQAGPIVVVRQSLVRVRWGNSLFARNWQIIIEAIDYMLAKHEVLRADRQGLARLRGRRAFAQAALGNRAAAMRDAMGALKLSPIEQRAYLAIAVAARLVSAERIVEMAHHRGRGI